MAGWFRAPFFSSLYALRLDYLTGLFRHFGSPGSRDVTGLITQRFGKYGFAFWYKIWYWALRNKEQVTRHS